MRKSLDKKKRNRILAGLLTLLLLFYFGYQFYLSRNKKIVTELAAYSTVADTVQTRGFIARSEETIQGSGAGVLSYRVADGTRVQKGGVIADVFSTEEDAAVNGQLDQLRREVSFLEELRRPTNTFSVTPEEVNEHIYMTLDEVISVGRDRNFSQMSGLRESLLSALNRKKLILGQESGNELDPEIQQLRGEIDSISASAKSAVGTVTSPRAGFFISQVDGLENSVNIEDIEDITVSEVRSLLALEPRKVENVAGKICTQFQWYVLSVIDENEMWHFENSDEVMLSIPFASSRSVPAKIVAENRDNTEGQVALVLECSYMDSGFADVRNTEIEITPREYSGVLVRESALRFEDVTYTKYNDDGTETEETAHNVKGVFIQSGRQLEFVQVFSERTVDGYAICKTELSDEELDALVTDHTIRAYDNVVVEGTDLYDGKPV